MTCVSSCFTFVHVLFILLGFTLFQEHVENLLGKVKTMGYKPLLATSECISFAPCPGGDFNLGCLVKMWAPLLSMVSPIPSYCRRLWMLREGVSWRFLVAIITGLHCFCPAQGNVAVDNIAEGLVAKLDDISCFRNWLARVMFCGFTLQRFHMVSC